MAAHRFCDGKVEAVWYPIALPAGTDSQKTIC